MMKIYVCTDHDYFWPVGVASVVIAEDEQQARTLLDAALRERGLKPEGGKSSKPYTLQEIAGPTAEILCDGDY